MSERRRLKTCAYCGDADGREGEHVFPSSWYPDTTPSSVQRLKVPACRACNERWEKVERHLAEQLLMVLSPTAPEMAGVHARLSRAWRAMTVQRPEERRHRMARAEKILRTMLWTAAVPGRAQATLRTPGGLLLRASPVRRLESHLFRDISEKIIRGLHYAESGGEVLRTLSVQAFWANADRSAQLGAPVVESLSAALALNPIHDLGPGFWYRRHHEGARSVWAFRIWGQVDILALANRSGEPVPA